MNISLMLVDLESNTNTS